MSQINGNAPQQQVGGPQLQQAGPVQAQRNEQGPPAGLGQHHSVGKTIGRIFLAILTLGISEAVFGIIRACKTEVAESAPHLPANKPPEPTIKDKNATRADNLKNGDEAMMAIVDRAKTKATTLLSGLATLDEKAFTAALQEEIKSCRTEVTDATLEELTEKVARNLHLKAAVRSFVETAPSTQGMDEKAKRLLTDILMTYPTTTAILGATDEKTLAPLVETAKDAVNEFCAYRQNSESLQKELFAEGLAKFYETTGLKPGSVTIKTNKLESSLNRMTGDISKPFITPERPYAKADKASLKAGWQPKCEEFFATRATTYNGIAKMNINEVTKQDWLNLCITSDTSLPLSTFSKLHNLMQQLTPNVENLKNLTKADMSMEAKQDIILQFAQQKHSAMLAEFSEEEFAKMGADGAGVLSVMILEGLFTEQPALLDDVKQNANMIKDVNAALRVKVAEASSTNNLSEAESLVVISGGELMNVLMRQALPVEQ